MKDRKNRIFMMLSAGQISAVIDFGYFGITYSLSWCAVILFALSTVLALYQIIQRISEMRTELALQTEHAKLLADDKQAEAKKYLDGITQYHKEQTPKLFCNNPYMNAVLQNYAAKGRLYGIPCTGRVFCAGCDVCGGIKIERRRARF